MREKTNKYLVAVVNTNPAKPAADYLKKAKSLGCSLILFPESYSEHREVSKLAALARNHQVYILAGINEMSRQRKYKSVFLYSPNGKVKRIHRKTILTNSEIRNGFKEGNSIEVFNSPFGKIGVSICLENWHPETQRILTLKGAEIVFAPSEFGMKRKGEFDFYDNWRDMLKIRAIENVAYVVCCTQAIGEKPLGVVINPEGRVLAERNKEGIITAAISLDKVRKMRKGDYQERIAAKIRFEKRRPELYSRISRKMILVH